MKRVLRSRAAYVALALILLLVLYSFLGSGSTIIAAERTGRRCFGLEIDPLYVDTIVRRWQAYTGEVARHAVSGRSFAEIEAEIEANHAR